MILVVMGVAGSGKTRVGREVAQRLGWPFVDADDLHPQANVDKMRAGLPLTDADREPWLERLRASVGGERDVVVACSALKRRFREMLAAGLPDLRFVYLDATPGLIDRRLRERQGHFFPPALAASQFAALEAPLDALVIDADQPSQAIVDAIATYLLGG